MPTYAQLQAEAVWGRELAPPSIAALAKKVCMHFGLTADAVGTKGDNNHVYGYHRSRAWVLGSRYCTNRTYSVTETAGNRSGGSDDWVCALDISAPPEILLPMCQRLDRAVRAGRLEKITEWYGNLDGDQRVDGYNNIANRVASSDSSHLWHLHLSFDRGRANEDHSDVLAILTGKENDVDHNDPLPEAATPDNPGRTWGQWAGDVWRAVHGVNQRIDATTQKTEAAVEALAAKVDALSAPQVDAAALAAALVANPDFRALLVSTSEEGANLAEDR